MNTSVASLKTDGFIGFGSTVVPAYIGLVSTRSLPLNETIKSVFFLDCNDRTSRPLEMVQVKHILAIITLSITCSINLCAQIPQLLCPNAKAIKEIGLVPEDLILQLVTLCVVVYNQALVVLGTLIHNVTEHLKSREHARIVVIDLLPIPHTRLPKDECEINVAAQVRCDTQWYL